MTKLTDFELIKRVNEIAQIQPRHEQDIEHGEDSLYISCDDGTNYYYQNPLTDDALCFQLMVKHKITVEFTRYYEHLKSTTAKAYYNDKSENGYGSYVRDKNPGKAICLAIIEAHNG